MNLQGSLPAFQFLVRCVSDVLLPGWIPNYHVPFSVSKLLVPKQSENNEFVLVRARAAQPAGDSQHIPLPSALLPGSAPAELAREHPHPEGTPGDTSTNTASSWAPRN